MDAETQNIARFRAAKFATVIEAEGTTRGKPELIAEARRILAAVVA